MSTELQSEWQWFEGAGLENGWNISPFLGTACQFGWGMFSSPAFLLCLLPGKSAPKPEHFGRESGHGTSPCKGIGW